MNAATLAAVGVSAGDKLQVSQGDAQAIVDAELDPRVADGVIRLAAAHPTTAGLATMFGAAKVARASGG
jgi:NADH-quinone oxidoreductase subunit G